jgi:hypothetical protein
MLSPKSTARITATTPRVTFGSIVGTPRFEDADDPRDDTDQTREEGSDGPGNVGLGCDEPEKHVRPDQRDHGRDEETGGEPL